MVEGRFDPCGVLTAEIVGHKFHCDNNGKFKSRPDGYCCCRNAKSSVDIPITLQRNPKNAYDANAIEVHGFNSCMLGHLSKELAATLAPLLDAGLLLLQGYGFSVSRGCPGDFFSLRVLIDGAGMQALPEGNRFAALWNRVKGRLREEGDSQDDDSC